MTNGNRALFVPRPFISSSLRGQALSPRPVVILFLCLLRLSSRSPRDTVGTRFSDKLFATATFVRRVRDKSCLPSFPFLLLFLTGRPIARYKRGRKLVALRFAEIAAKYRLPVPREQFRQISRDHRDPERRIFILIAGTYFLLCLSPAMLLRNAVAQQECEQPLTGSEISRK